MLKTVLTFALTRRPIILLCVLVLIGSGVLAYRKLNIEAYPNPAPVILEITAQASGQSAEEMERYYTIPMEVGLAATPGVENIRSTSFYGLSFVRVTFKYGVDFYFAYTQTALSLQQKVNLPNNVQPSIQGSSLVGEIFRYQVVGPPNFGLTNLRTVQDWVLQRRLLTVPGVVQVNTWGGTTKEFEVETGTRGSPAAIAWASTKLAPHGVHRHPVERLVERGQEPDDFEFRRPVAAWSAERYPCRNSRRAEPCVSDLTSSAPVRLEETILRLTVPSAEENAGKRSINRMGQEVEPAFLVIIDEWRSGVRCRIPNRDVLTPESCNAGTRQCGGAFWRY